MRTRTDIFSLGTVFYELLTARNPFSGPTYDVVLERVMNTTPDPASDVNPSVGPAERNLTVLAPRTPGAGEDFAAFALGAVDLLNTRLQKHQDRAGFQLGSFQESLDEKLASADDAHRAQGANLALRLTLEQRTDVFRARLELWDAKRGRQIASRTVETPISRPFEFLDGLYREAVRMLRLSPRSGDAAFETGVRGSGTLRFLLQGIGRTRTATTEEQARRAVDDLELACRTEPDAGLARGWRSVAERKCFTLGADRAWLDRAEASAREAVGRDSARAEAHRFLSAAYDQAIDTLKLSIALRPDQIAFDNLGTAYFNSGRLEEAVEAYNQAFQFGFASYMMWLNLGDAYYWLRGRRDQAADAYAEAVRLGREEASKRASAGRAPDVMIPALLSTIFPRIGQPDSARAYLARALQADSTNARVQHCAALTWWQLGDRGQAMAWLERAVRNGYPVAWIRDSPVFQEWRAEESFRALIAGAGPETQRSTSPVKGGRT